MRSWRRADRELWCGAAVGCQIAQYAPYCILSGEGWQKLRCQQHALCPVPDDFDQVPVQPRLTVPDFTRVGKLGHDWARKAAGERDDE